MPGTKKRSRRDDEKDDDSEVEVSKLSRSNKKSKTGAVTDSGKDDEGNFYWGLSGTRRATISEFKGKQYVNIREYYSDADGNLKPTKKGIMLPLNQYDELVKAIPAINAQLSALGHETPAITSSAPVAESSEPTEKAKKGKKAQKANIEATSDEEEDSED